MDFRDLIVAVNVIQEYVPDGNVSAEHDEIWLPGPSPEEMKESDVKILEDLGFSWESEFDTWHHYL